MEFLTGFLIAFAIGLTGLGAGTITAPVLMLFFGLPTTHAVTVALVFGTVTKLFAAPLYIWRRQVDFRVLGYLVLGGLPGVLGGTLLLQHLDKAALTGPVLMLVGATVLLSSLSNLARARASVDPTPAETRVSLLPWLTAPIGLEVGFSSAGAGALGTLVLLRYTRLTPGQVVGTDMLFGFVLSLVGGGLHAALTGLPTDLLFKLLVGGIPGVLIGAHMSTVLPARKLRLGLCVWLVYLGSQLLYRGAGAIAW